MSQESRPYFDRLAPVNDRYATLPVAEAFTWGDCSDDVGPGEWYLVAFRSTRAAGVDEARLTAHDDWAHAEASDAPGFVHYYKGPTDPDGRCMSFCLWDSRAEARSAAARPSHMQAASLTHDAYAEYTLEFHRMRRLAEGGGFTFEPYDAAPPKQFGAGAGSRRLSPKLAPS